MGYQDGHGHCGDLAAWPAHRKGDAGWLGDEDSAGIAGELPAAGGQYDLPSRRTDGLAARHGTPLGWRRRIDGEVTDPMAYL